MLHVRYNVSQTEISQIQPDLFIFSQNYIVICISYYIRRSRVCATANYT